MSQIWKANQLHQFEPPTPGPFFREADWANAGEDDVPLIVYERRTLSFRRSGRRVDVDVFATPKAWAESEREILTAAAPPVGR